MILDARRGRGGWRGVLIDETTGQRIPNVRWVNTETGEYETAELQGGRVVVARRRGRVRFIPGHVLQVKPAAPVPALAAPRPASGAQMLQVRRLRGRRLLAWLLEEKDCQQYGCHRKAQWETADEVHLPPVEVMEAVPPLVAANGDVLVPATSRIRLFEQAAVVRTHYWCHQHYQPPGIQWPDGSIDPQELPGSMGRPQ